MGCADRAFSEELNHFSRRLSEMSSSNRLLLSGAPATHRPDDMNSFVHLLLLHLLFEFGVVLGAFPVVYQI